MQATAQTKSVFYTTHLVGLNFRYVLDVLLRKTNLMKDGIFLKT